VTRAAPPAPSGFRGLGALARAGWFPLLVLALSACGSDAGESRLPALVSPPLVPPLDDVVAEGESRAFDLDLPGGGTGAPFGANLFVPPGAAGEADAGLLSDGSRGARLVVPGTADTVLCASPVNATGSLEVTARLRIAAVAAPAAVELELRPRDAGGELVSPPDARYVRLHRWDAPSDWAEWTATGALPEGAVKAEVCLRFVGGPGELELDRLVVQTPGIPLPPVVPVVSRRWDLDQPGGSRGAPLGFEFLIPPGTTGVTLDTDLGADEGDARGAHIRVTTKGNAVICSEGFAAASGMVGRARVKVREVESDARPWTGFVVEVRTYDLVGGLVSPGGGPFTLLRALKEPADWQDVAVAFAPPAEATTAKLCLRFVEATGDALVDWAAVGGAEGG
jgi:hypothetical protein